MVRSRLVVFALSVGLVACGGQEAVSEAPPAPDGAPAAGLVASLKTSDGAAAGTATANPVEGGVALLLMAEGLPPGTRGAHVHTTGRCEGPTFDSAGDHWNPTNAMHGLENPMGPHLGDMPNLTVGADGRGTLTFTLAGASLEALMDGDGAAVVIHTDPDDQRTDPAGDSGDRIACGVFVRG